MTITGYLKKNLIWGFIDILWLSAVLGAPDFDDCNAFKRYFLDEKKIYDKMVLAIASR